MKTRSSRPATLKRLVAAGALFFSAAAFATPTPPAPPADSPEVTADAPDDAYTPPFARVRFLEGAARLIHRDGSGEDLQLNSPVYVDDRVETAGDGRLELQLPDGSLVRVDQHSNVEIYDLLDPQRADSASLLGLGAGGIQVDVSDPRNGETFRIDTPAASVYPVERSSFRVDLETGDAVRVSVARGQVEVSGQDNSVLVRSGQRTRVAAGEAPGRPWTFNVMARDGFDRWIDDREGSYRLRANPGREYEDLPQPVRPYYAELSRYGQWVWTDEYGWTWKPGDVDPDWRPYLWGDWAYGPYGSVWVGDEPWGWPVYRYGRWGWSVGAGWFWIPGRVFAPAHVYWYYGANYVGWCPLGYWDSPVWLSVGFTWGDPWFDGYPWVFAHHDHFFYTDMRHGHVPRASVIPHDLRNGYVGRRAVVTPISNRAGARPGEGRPGPYHAVSPDTFRRARELASGGRANGDMASVQTARPVGRPGGGPGAPRSPFSERERALVQRQMSSATRSPVRGGAPAGVANQPSRGRPGAGAGATRGGPSLGARPRRFEGAGPGSGAPRSAPSPRGGGGASRPGGSHRGGHGRTDFAPSNDSSLRPPSFQRNQTPAESTPFARREQGAARTAPGAREQGEGGAAVRRFLDRIANDDRSGQRTLAGAAEGGTTRPAPRTYQPPRFVRPPEPPRTTQPERPRVEAPAAPRIQPPSLPRTDAPRIQPVPAPRPQAPRVAPTSFPSRPPSVERSVAPARGGEGHSAGRAAAGRPRR